MPRKRDIGEGGVPARYDEMFADEAQASSVVSSPSGERIESSGPASVIRGAQQVVETFDRAGDEPGDPDRPSQMRLRIDPISTEVGSQHVVHDQRFDWCRGIDGYRMRFSRRYPDLSLIVDVFSQDSPAVRKEVARKRMLIEQHNAEVQSVYDEASDDSRAFMCARGLGPTGYAPIFAGKFDRHDVDWDSARAGAVLDLPPTVIHPQWEPSGVGVQAVGVR